MQTKFLFAFFCMIFSFREIAAQEPKDKPFWLHQSGVIHFFDANGFETDTYHCGDARLTELDLNSDGYEELIVAMQRGNNSGTFFSMVIFDGSRVFSFVDSLYSGLVEPEVDYHSELNSFVIICGNPVLDSIFLTKGGKGSYNPLRYYVYDGEELPEVSSDLYEDYARTNEMLVEMLTEQYAVDSYICQVSEEIFGMVATIVLNYMVSEEKALAKKYFEKFYNCPDKQQILTIIQEMN
ncbi:MAG: hypothetical protein IT279_13565 [Ignavibacteriaceae bacterium]|nr:hypothetical protein [Ignavibacteriaceae bacterium]